MFRLYSLFVLFIHAFTIAHCTASDDNLFKSPDISAGIAIIQLDGTTNVIELRHYHRDGTLDIHFGNQGKRILILPDATRIQCVYLQHDGKILAAGSQIREEIPHFIVLRYNHDGTLDETFGEKGISHKALGFGFATALDVQSDNKILVTGFTAFHGHTLIATVRYQEDGTLDTEFGNEGVVTTAIGPMLRAMILLYKMTTKIS